MKDRLLVLCQVYKIVVGIIGVVATVAWCIFLVGSDASLILDGKEVMGTIGTTLVVLGNGYAMWQMAKDGLVKI